MKKSDVIEYFGGTAATARALTEAGYPCSRQAVDQWGDQIPKMREIQAQKIMQGPPADDDAKQQLKRLRMVLREILDSPI